MGLIFGLIIGAGLVALVLWILSRGVVTRWYEWLIGILGLIALLFTIQNFAASFNLVNNCLLRTLKEV